MIWSDIKELFDTFDLQPFDELTESEYDDLLQLCSDSICEYAACRFISELFVEEDNCFRFNITDMTEAESAFNDFHASYIKEFLDEDIKSEKRPKLILIQGGKVD